MSSPSANMQVVFVGFFLGDVLGIGHGALDRVEIDLHAFLPQDHSLWRLSGQHR